MIYGPNYRYEQTKIQLRSCSTKIKCKTESSRKDLTMAEDESIREELKATEHRALDKLKQLKAQVSEDEQTPVGALTLRKITSERSD